MTARLYLTIRGRHHLVTPEHFGDTALFLLNCDGATGRLALVDNQAACDCDWDGRFQCNCPHVAALLRVGLLPKLGKSA